jgi:hypothetical protein
MKMRRIATRVVMFSLSLATGIALTWLVLPSLFFSPLDGGPLDYQPRLEASAVTLDNNLVVKIYRQRDPTYSRILGADVFVQVSDSQGRVLYRDEFGRDGAWSELNSEYGISFGGNEIRVTRLWCPGCGPDPTHKTIKFSELRGSAP